MKNLCLTIFQWLETPLQLELVIESLTDTMLRSVSSKISQISFILCCAMLSQRHTCIHFRGSGTRCLGCTFLLPLFGALEMKVHLFCTKFLDLILKIVSPIFNRFCCHCILVTLKQSISRQQSCPNTAHCEMR